MIEFNQYEERFSAIELLGFAKNYIVEAKESESDLPEQHRAILSIAYHLLTLVQEHLYL